MAYFFDIELKHSESFYGFLKWSNEVRLQIENCSLDTVLTAFVNSIHHTYLKVPLASANQSLLMNFSSASINTLLRRSLRWPLKILTPKDQETLRPKRKGTKIELIK